MLCFWFIMRSSLFTNRTSDEKKMEHFCAWLFFCIICYEKVKHSSTKGMLLLCCTCCANQIHISLNFHYKYTKKVMLTVIWNSMSIVRRIDGNRNRRKWQTNTVQKEKKVDVGVGPHDTKPACNRFQTGCNLNKLYNWFCLWIYQWMIQIHRLVWVDDICGNSQSFFFVRIRAILSTIPSKPMIISK